MARKREAGIVAAVGTATGGAHVGAVGTWWRLDGPAAEDVSSEYRELRRLRDSLREARARGGQANTEKRARKAQCFREAIDEIRGRNPRLTLKAAMRSYCARTKQWCRLVTDVERERMVESHLRRYRRHAK